MDKGEGEWGSSPVPRASSRKRKSRASWPEVGQAKILGQSQAETETDQQTRDGTETKTESERVGGREDQAEK